MNLKMGMTTQNIPIFAKGVSYIQEDRGDIVSFLFQSRLATLSKTVHSPAPAHSGPIP